MNTGENEFVGQLISTAQTEFEGALAVADRNKARLLLRLFAALVPSNALHASSVLNALHSIIEAAIEVADAGMARRWGLHHLVKLQRCGSSDLSPVCRW